MRYLLAILLPPVAVLICGKPVQAIVNLLLTLFFWIPGMIHALFIAHGYYEDKRTDKILGAIKDEKSN